MGFFRDHRPKKPTKREIEEAQQLMVAEQQKQKEFIDKYNYLCAEYGYTIVPQVTVQLAKRQ